MQHTEKCSSELAKRNAEIAAWVARWPHYCRVCNGYGQMTEEFDPSPAGVSLSPGSMTDVYPCESCTDCRVCARCGMIGLTIDASGPCRHCGWNYDDGLPPEYECYCWEETYIESTAENHATLGELAYDDISFDELPF